MNLSNINNLVELFFKQVENQKDKKKVLLSSLKDKNISFTWEKTYQAINILSEEIKKNVTKGDRCLLVSENRPEWFISDLSIMLSGSITVPAYTTYAERDYEYIINDCSPTVVFVSNDEQFRKLKNIIKNKNFIKKIFSFEKLSDIEEDNYININDLFSKSTNENSNSRIEITRKDPACIIYTSGTQGNPKGVILSHGGILNNCEGAIEILKPLIKKDQTRFLTWLPLSHSYEHTVQFVQITVAARVFYAESIEKLIKNMNDCRPEIMTAVPRFYQNLYQKINASFNKATGVKKMLVQKMLNLGLKKIKKEPLNLIEKIQLNSVKDINKFEINSIKILYSLPINTFTLIADKKDNIFIAKVISYEDMDISQNSNKFISISNEASAENRNGILKSYDYLLNDKYKVIVDEKTLDRVKNYFR